MVLVLTLWFGINIQEGPSTPIRDILVIFQGAFWYEMGSNLREGFLSCGTQTLKLSLQGNSSVPFC